MRSLWSIQDFLHSRPTLMAYTFKQWEIRTYRFELDLGPCSCGYIILKHPSVIRPALLWSDAIYHSWFFEVKRSKVVDRVNKFSFSSERYIQNLFPHFWERASQIYFVVCSSIILFVCGHILGRSLLLHSHDAFTAIILLWALSRRKF